MEAEGRKRLFLTKEAILTIIMSAGQLVLKPGPLLCILKCGGAGDLFVAMSNGEENRMLTLLISYYLQEY